MSENIEWLNEYYDHVKKEPDDAHFRVRRGFLAGWTAAKEQPVSPSLNNIDNVEAEDGIRFLIANHKETEGDSIGTLIFKLKDESSSLRQKISRLEEKCEINRLNAHNFEINCNANMLSATCFKVQRDELIEKNRILNDDYSELKKDLMQLII